MSWFKKLLPLIKSEQKRGGSIPEGLWTKCDACSTMLYQADLENNLYVCPKCEHHHRISARKRIDIVLDTEKRIELESADAFDHLKFKDSKKYIDRVKTAKKETKETEALVSFQGFLKGIPVVVSSFDFFFMGGSMGSAVGENFVRAAHRALEYHIPLICFSASGGARMQEGLISLMQMAKTSAVLTRLAEEKIPYISVLTDPTMGGVSASLAMLGDLIIAEPNALIGFAGPRVIEQTVRAVLPSGFQKSEFLMSHGGIDMIIDRRQMRDSLADIISKLLRQPSSRSSSAERREEAYA